ncbi:MAG: biopolymer transporter ExbD [Aquificota bacterium]|nr:MAG: biopolymer transporter ExbD [Aquificota bacterium]
MRFFRDKEEDFSLDYTPLIDVVFLLLIFFMVSTQFVTFHKRLEVVLPKAKASVVKEKKKELVIEMTADGQIFVDGKLASLAFLEAYLKRERGKIGATVIRADSSLPYGDVVRVMGLCKEAGVTEVGIAVR